jgi:hypothetical protein
LFRQQPVAVAAGAAAEHWQADRARAMRER